MNKKIAVVAGIIILLLAVILTVFFWPRVTVAPTLIENPNIPAQPAFNFAAPQRWDDIYIASKILSWLENEMRDERGTYNMFSNCNYDDNGELICDNNSVSNRTGTPVIWANYLYWRRTGDPTAWERLQNALAIYSNNNIVELLQTDNLSCYYMLPIANDQSITQTMRDQAANICFRTIYETPAFYEQFADLEPDTYKFQSDQLISNIIDNITAPTVTFDPTLPPHPVVPTNLGEIIPKYSWLDFATDLAVLYKFDPSPDRLNFAYYHFAGALSVYAQDPASLGNQCRLLLASQQFCQIADNIDDPSCQLTENLTGFIASNPVNSDFSLTSAAKCALTAPTLKQKFLSLIRDYYFSDRNAFYQLSDSPWLLNENGSSTKSVMSNALFVGLLSL